MASPKKKSPSSKARRKTTRPVAALCERRSQPARDNTRRRSQTAATSQAAKLRSEFRAWRAEQPTALERDTLLVPEWVAESVVQEAERFLDAKLANDFVERLAAKAHYLYPRHKHFKKMLNRAGNRGRDSLFMYMRHWTSSWLKRECYSLHKRLPRSYAMGQCPPDRQA